MKTKLFKLTSPLPAEILQQELEEQLPNRDVQILDDDSCLMFDLTYEEMKQIQGCIYVSQQKGEKPGVLIHEFKIDKEITIE